MGVLFGFVFPRFYRGIAILALLVCGAAFAPGQANPANGRAGPEVLSCSPAPCVLPPTQVSPGPYTVNSAPIAVDPSNARNIIVGANQGNCGFEGEPTTGFFVSTNAGSAWNLVCMSGRTVDGQIYVPVGGPVLGYDQNGSAYVGGFYVDNGSVALEGFEKSNDGIHWSPPAAAVYRKGYSPATCWMAVDTGSSSPYEGAVYVACAMIEGIGHKDYYQMAVSHSNDGGRTWRLANVGPQQVSPVEETYDSLTVGGDGTVYVTWQYCNQDNFCGNGPAYMLFSKSTDGGNTWSKPTVVAKADLIYPLPNVPGAFVSNRPAIVADSSKGLYAGNLYVAMYNWTGTFMQVVVARSTDGGSTWSKPVPVAPGITHDQFFPWLSVSPTGLVGVIWLDRRNDPANINYQAFAGISSDGGLTFQPNRPANRRILKPEPFLPRERQL